MKEICHYQFIIPLLGVSSDSRNMYVGEQSYVWLFMRGMIGLTCECVTDVYCDINVYWLTVYEHESLHICQGHPVKFLMTNGYTVHCFDEWAPVLFICIRLLACRRDRGRKGWNNIKRRWLPFIGNLSAENISSFSSHACMSNSAAWP